MVVCHVVSSLTPSVSVAGKLDHLPEQSFYMAGGIDEVKANAEKLGVTV